NKKRHGRRDESTRGSRAPALLQRVGLECPQRHADHADADYSVQYRRREEAAEAHANERRDDVIRERCAQHPREDRPGFAVVRREHEGKELSAVAHLGDGHRRERDQERFHQETPDRAVATKRQGPPSLVPEDLPLVSPYSKASYATGFHPSVLTYDPVGAGRSPGRQRL